MTKMTQKNGKNEANLEFESRLSEFREMLQKRERPIWKKDIEFKVLLLSDTFPDDVGFPSSFWATWEDRVSAGHEEEKRRLSELAEKWSPPEGSENWPIDPDEWLADDFWQACRLANSMYASLVVSIWSEMEHFLKSLVKTCRMAITPPDNTIKPITNKKIKEIKSIDEVVKFYKSKFRIDLYFLTDFEVIDGIRILNNSYKHSKGFYKPDASKPATKINQTLLDRWGILNESGEIDYTSLPIKELVISCNSFCRALLGESSKAIECKLGLKDNKS